MGKNNSKNSGARTAFIVIIAGVIILALAIRAWQRLTPRPPKIEPPIINLEDPTLEIRSLDGQVLNIKNNSLTVEIPSILGVEIPKNSPLRVRTVMLDQATQFNYEIEKSSAVYAEEMKIYQQKKDEGKFALPPRPKENRNITIQDIKVGDYVYIVGINSQDLKERKTFLASEITVK